MTYEALYTSAEKYANGLRVESLLSFSALRRLEKIFRLLFCLALFVWLALFLVRSIEWLAALFPGAALWSESFSPLARALLILVAGLYAALLSLRAFFYSSYFKDMELTLPEPGMRQHPPIRYEVAAAAAVGSGDPALDFFATRFGVSVVQRLGLEPKEVAAFLAARASAPTSALEVQESAAPFSLADLARSLIRSDGSLRQFLAGKAVEAEDFAGAAAFVSRMEAQRKSALRWWSRDTLGRIPGIGKTWAYGETAFLERYAADIRSLSVFLSFGETAFGVRESEEIERILSRERAANVLVVHEEGVPALELFARLARNIVAGTILPPLEHKRIFVLDGTLFVSAFKEKAAFEHALLRLASEAAAAGNIVLLIDHLDSFALGAATLQSDALGLLEPFLASTTIQIAGTALTGAFHQFLEPNPKIREHFERVLVEGGESASVLPLLEDEALRLETKDGVFFTFQSLQAVAQSAERYFGEGALADKGVDILLELPQKAKAERKSVITAADVLDLVSKKTGIAVGEAGKEERAKLLKLEEILRARVVGQDEAVAAISGALRRARSGIGNPNRPLGSFLFLGPTGVGKTETTKVLAQAFFGDEQQIIRFDMSEYQTGDALERLIGSFEGGKPGVLASALRERPYGVLLLDEFEKTNKDVHDLFLQILDEGFFTDAAGKRVNARNLMVIATSNAASDMVWNMKHGTPEQDKDSIMTEIINRAIFKPELLNRFDGVILFHPISSENLRVIARLQLQKLAKRLEEKGLELVITDPLLDSLVSVGQDPKFGARPMNRAIQEKVEQVIAEKLLRGELAAGSRVELTASDLPS